ncbi:MAG TPA: ABC transporter permease [Kofleriaceae bacterium]|jgi:phospholipid/cholesterol/gamma-HCH transport system permease protein|nr:ABC transporter permease [Kofleriaceae bacterium]
MTIGRRTLIRIGARTLAAGTAALDLISVAIQTIVGSLWSYWRGKRPKGAIARQMYFVGNRSLLFVLVTLGFVGMVMVYQTCLLTTKIIDGRNQVGAQWARLLVLDVGPSLTAMMLATRVGAGIAAEVGSMKVTEQLDALRMSGVTPVRYLIVPRFLACIVMSVALSMFGMAASWGAGGLTGYYSFQINPRIFFDLSLVQPSHVAVGIMKAVAFGAAIPIVSGFCGLRAQGSSEGVGAAATAAVIGSSFAVLILDVLISFVAMVALGAGM